ncbi:M1 family aminopeptidase [Amycolatopsis sp.]|uniref:M1 family aminopeptidase n=1 Tax=Amycolatopsis sp. TaxID=37632 RepID=UPI0039C869C0
MERTARETPGQLAWLAGEIGRPFPFERYGVLGLASGYDGVALETATVSTFGAGLSLTPEQEAPTLVHELTHQYFGDAVSVRTWDDMWLSEGHARYYERRYAAARGFIDLDQELKSSYERDQQQRTEVGPMGRDPSGGQHFPSDRTVLCGSFPGSGGVHSGLRRRREPGLRA